MAAQEPFTVTLEANPLECWDDESTASALRALAVFSSAQHSSGFASRETVNGSWEAIASVSKNCSLFG